MLTLSLSCVFVANLFVYGIFTGILLYLYLYPYDSVLVVTNVFVTVVLYYSHTSYSYVSSAHATGIICTGTLLVLFN
jgi:hypothetical protein